MNHPLARAYAAYPTDRLSAALRAIEHFTADWGSTRTAIDRVSLGAQTIAISGTWRATARHPSGRGSVTLQWSPMFHEWRTVDRFIIDFGPIR